MEMHTTDEICGPGVWGQFLKQQDQTKRNQETEVKLPTVWILK